MRKIVSKSKILIPRKPPLFLLVLFIFGQIVIFGGVLSDSAILIENFTAQELDEVPTTTITTTTVPIEATTKITTTDNTSTIVTSTLSPSTTEGTTTVVTTTTSPQTTTITTTSEPTSTVVTTTLGPSTTQQATTTVTTTTPPETTTQTTTSENTSTVVTSTLETTTIEPTFTTTIMNTTSTPTSTTTVLKIQENQTFIIVSTDKNEYYINETFLVFGEVMVNGSYVDSIAGLEVYYQNKSIKNVDVEVKEGLFEQSLLANFSEIGEYFVNASAKGLKNTTSFTFFLNDTGEGNVSETVKNVTENITDTEFPLIKNESIDSVIINQNGTVRLIAIVTDDFDVENVTFTIRYPDNNSISYLTTNISELYSYDFSYTQQFGTHEWIRTKACDISGKCNYSYPSLNFTVVETVPEPEIKIGEVNYPNPVNFSEYFEINASIESLYGTSENVIVTLSYPDIFEVNGSIKTLSEVDSDGEAVTWNVKPNSIGNYSFNITAESQLGNRDFRIMEIEVKNITEVLLNQPPELLFEIPNVIMYENSNYTRNFTTYFSDPDGNELKLSFEVLENETMRNIDISIFEDTFTVNTSSNSAGNWTIIFTASDGNLSAKSNNVTLLVKKRIQLEADFDSLVKELKIPKTMQVGKSKEIVLKIVDTEDFIPTVQTRTLMKLNGPDVEKTNNYTVFTYNATADFCGRNTIIFMPGIYSKLDREWIIVNKTYEINVPCNDSSNEEVQGFVILEREKEFLEDKIEAGGTVKIKEKVNVKSKALDNTRKTVEIELPRMADKVVLPDEVKREQKYRLLDNEPLGNKVKVEMENDQEKELEFEYEIKGPLKRETVERSDKWRKKIEIEENKLYDGKEIIVKTEIPESKSGKLEIVSGGNSFDTKEEPELKVRLSGKRFRLIPSHKGFDLLSNDEEEISFKKIDEDSDGSVDSIEWISKTGEEFILEEADLTEPEIHVFNSLGEPVNAKVEKKPDGSFDLKISKGRDFRPGRYIVVAETDEESYSTWFDWGLISINTKKSIYRPGEEAEIIMVVLDKYGYLVSDADVDLEVTDPRGNKRIFSTDFDTVEEVQRGIYKAFYDVEVEGRHELFAKSEGEDVENTIESYFESMEEFDFDIIRGTPVTLDPRKEKFNSSIQVISYNGVDKFNFTEYLPASFDIIDSGGAKIKTIGDIKVLRWENIEDASIVSYSAEVPLVWPYLYQIGPSEVKYGDETFREARPWMFAVDPGLWINFVNPTPYNNEYINENFALINVSLNQSKLTSAFIDWNRSLVGYWNFSEASGTTVNDSSSYGNNGTVTGGLKSITGRYGDALEFNTTNNVSIPFSQSLNLTDNFTIEMWVNSSSNNYLEAWMNPNRTYVHHPWHNSSFNYRLPITIDSNVSQDEYQIMVDLMTSGENQFDYDKVYSNGSDIRFYDSDGDKLDYHFHWWEYDGDSLIWVKTNITNGTNYVYMYYNSSTVTNNESSVEDVFTYSRDYPIYYTVHGDAQGDQMDIVSYFEGIHVDFESTDEVLAQYGTTSESVNDVSVPLMVNGSIAGAMDQEDTDAPVPISWAGKKLGFALNRGSEDWSICAMWGDASFDVICESSSNHEDNTISNGTCQQFGSLTCDGSYSGGAIIESNVSIMVVQDTSGQDSAILRAADTYASKAYPYDLWGAGIHYMHVVSHADDVNVDIYVWNQTGYYQSASTTLDKGVSYDADSVGDISTARHGQGCGVHIVADGPVSAHQMADGDGSQAYSFNKFEDLDTEIVIPTDVQFVTIVAPFNATNVSVYTLGESYIDGDFLYHSLDLNYALSTCFGYCDDSPESAWQTGVIVRADKPIHVEWEYSDSDSDESEAFGRVSGRRWHPEVALPEFGSEETDIDLTYPEYILEKENSYRLNVLRTEQSSSSNMLKSEIGTGLQHVAMIVDNSDFSFYINGSLIGTKTLDEKVNDNDNNITIGRDLNGSIDEFRFWNRVLTQEEILASYNASAYPLYHNFTNLDGVYNYYAYAIEKDGDYNQTETRTLYVDLYDPTIGYLDPTYQNDTYIFTNHTYVNVSLFDMSQTTSFVNWNNTLIGHWKFDWLDTNTVIDSSGYGNNGTRTGPIGQNKPQITDGKFNMSLDFDGEDDYVYVSSSSTLNITDEITLEAWVNTTESVLQPIVGKYDGSSDRSYSIYLNSSGILSFALSTDGSSVTQINASTSVNDGEWHHLAGTWNGTDMKVYVDGALENSGPFSGSLYLSNQDLRIGRRSTDYFNGSIDEVRVWSRDIVSEEVNASYNSKINSLEVNFTDLLEGTYSYYAYTHDLFSNSNQTETRWITLNFTPDNTYPQWSNNETSAVNGTTYNNQEVNFNITLSDNYVGREYIFSYDNGTGTFVNETSVSWRTDIDVSITKTIVGTKDDLVRWKWYFNDSYGNMNSTPIWNFTVGNAPPEVPQLNSPVAYGSRYTNVPFNLTYNSSDVDGDSINYYFFFDGEENLTTADENVTMNLTRGKYNWTIVAGDGISNSTARGETEVRWVYIQPWLDWLDLEWGYRKLINITNTAGNQTEFQIFLNDIDTETLISEGKMQSDCGDIRFGNTTGDPIPYYVEPRWCNSNTSWIWVQVPFLENNVDTTIYMYYGSLNEVNTTGDEEEVFNYSVNTSVLIPLGSNNAYDNDAYGNEPAHEPNQVNSTVTPFRNDTNIAGGTYYGYLDQGVTDIIHTSQQSNNTLFNTTRPIAIENTPTNGSFPGDSYVPLAWATKQYMYPFYRYCNRFYFYSPYGTATVQMYYSSNNGTGFSSSSTETITVPQNEVRYSSYDTDCGGSDNSVFKFESDLPVIAFVESRSSSMGFPMDRDNFPAHENDTELYGIPSQYLDVGAIYDDTIIKVYFSDQIASQTLYVDEGEILELTTTFIPGDIGGSNADGQCHAAHIVANKPVMGVQTADSDGTDVTTFLPEYELGREYMIPGPAEYISVVTITPNTKCDLYDENNDLYDTETSISNTMPFPGHIYFGAEDGPAFIDSGRLVCNASVYAYYEYDTTSDEHNLLSMKAMRKHAYPEPNYTVTTEETVIPVLNQTSMTPTPSGWGEEHDFTVYGFITDNETVKVDLWYSDSSAGPYTYKTFSVGEYLGEYKEIPFDDIRFSCTDLGTNYYKFNATAPSGQSAETDVKTFVLEKDDVIVEYASGDDVEINRSDLGSGYQYKVTTRINDTDNDTYAMTSGINGTFWVTRNGVDYNTYSASTNETGHMYITTNNGYFNPTCDYQVGTQSWFMEVTDDEPCYKQKTSNIFNINITGDMENSVTNPTGSPTYTMGTDIDFRGTITSDCSNSINDANVSFVVERNEAIITVCDAEWYGSYYNCTWDTLGQTEGTYNVTMNSTREHYNPNSTMTDFSMVSYPILQDLQVNQSSITWNNALNFSINVTDADDTVNVTFWLNMGGAGWELENFTSCVNCNNEMVSFAKHFTKYNISSWSYKFNATDTNQNTNEKPDPEGSFTVNKKEINWTHVLGNNSIANRQGSQYATLKLMINDTETDAPFSDENLTFYVTRDGVSDYSYVGSNITGPDGNATINFNPTCSPLFDVGDQKWKATVIDGSTYYTNPDSSTNISLNTTVMGDVHIVFLQPDGDENPTQEDSINFLASTTDDCGSPLNPTIKFFANNTTNFYSTGDVTLIGANAYSSDWVTNITTPRGYYNATVEVNMSGHYDNETHNTNAPGLFYLDPIYKLDNISESYASPTSEGWGYRNWNFTINSSSGDPDTVYNVTFHINKGSPPGPVECDEDTCLNQTPKECSYPGCVGSVKYWYRNFTYEDQGTWFYKFMLHTAYTSGNDIITIEKDDINISYVGGNDIIVNRSSTQSQILTVHVNDTDRNEDAADPDATVYFNITNQSQNYLTYNSNTTQTNGEVLIDFNPTCDYEIGPQNWTTYTNGDSNYKNENSSTFNLTIYGDLEPQNVKIYNSTYDEAPTLYQGDTVNVTGTLKDDCGNIIEESTGVVVEFKVYKNDTHPIGELTNCTDVSYLGSGVYSCQWPTNTTDYENGTYQVLMNASNVVYYNKGTYTRHGAFGLGVPPNSPPELSAGSVSPNPGGWGSFFNFSVNVTDNDYFQNVTVYLWESETGSEPWSLVEEKACEVECTQHNEMTMLFNKTTYNCGDIGTKYYKFNATDNSSTSSAESENLGPYSFQLIRDNIEFINPMGNNGFVNRSGNQNILLGVRVNDTTKNVLVGDAIEAGRIWVTTDTTNYDDGTANLTSNSSSYINFTFNPNCSTPRYTISNSHKWRAGVLDDTCYNDTNSSEYSLTIKGDLINFILEPDADVFSDLENITILANITSDCRDDLLNGANVNFTVSHEGNVYTTFEDPAPNNGTFYNTTWNATGYPEGDYSITMNSTLDNYNQNISTHTSRFHHQINPKLSDANAYASPVVGVWGATFTFNYKITDDDDDVTVQMWRRCTGGNTTPDSEIPCHENTEFQLYSSDPCSDCVDESKSFSFNANNYRDIGDYEWFINVSDSNGGYNVTSTKTYNVTKRNIFFQLAGGNATEVNRIGNNKTSLSVYVYTYTGTGYSNLSAGKTIKFYVTTEDDQWSNTDQSGNMQNTSNQPNDPTGFVQFNFNPSCSPLYQTGHQWWNVTFEGGTGDGDNSYYPNSSFNFSFFVNASLVNYIIKPNETVYNLGDTINIEANVSDECGQQVSGATVNFRIKDDEQDADNVQNPNDGNYTGTWDSSGQGTGWRHLEMNSSKVYYDDGTYNKTNAFQVWTAPSISSESIDPDESGWGNTYGSSVYVVDPDGGEVNVSLWKSVGGSEWEYMLTESCTASDCISGDTLNYNPVFHCDDYVNGPGINLKFNATDNYGLTDETSNFTLTLHKDSVEFVKGSGDGETINRESGSQLFTVTIKDTNKSSTPVNVTGEEGQPINGSFYFGTEEGTFDWGHIVTINDDTGVMSYTLDPNCSYQVGSRNWYAEISGNGCYHDTSMGDTDGSYYVKGQLYSDLYDPLEDSEWNVTDPIDLGWNVYSDCYDQGPYDNGNITGVTNTIDLNYLGNTSSCDDVNDPSSDGNYNCTWDSTSMAEGNWTVNITAELTNYNQNFTTHPHWFYLNNLEANLTNQLVDPSSGGWGTNYTYNISITDNENDSTSCQLYVKTTGSWEYKGMSTITPPGNCSVFVDDYTCADQTTAEFYSIVNDTYNTINTSETIGITNEPVIGKNDLGVTLSAGNASYINRSDANGVGITYDLALIVNDTTKNSLPLTETNGTIWITTDGSSYDIGT
ncbi:MAG: DUF2341 domain-containing protein, partial [Candidatus Aenigmarchaeota archaeon]|nr:DUF2341 domain-containing protein [Candidatus Aenigmarchaeota archaeon]